MDTIPYTFDGRTGSIEVTERDPDRPLVILLHGTGGTISDMTTPAVHPDNNYDYRSPLSPDVTIGWRAYPGIGVWSCCDLDPKMDVRSWRDVLSQYKFGTAAYSQVDNDGFLARPVAEFAVVIGVLMKHCPDTPLVVLTHSRGGLLIRKFLKDLPELAGSIRKVITLHAPHTGSSLASIADFIRTKIEQLQSLAGDVVLQALGWLLDMADSDAFREMAVGSPFLTDLAGGEQPLRGVDYYTFGGVSVRLTRIRTWVYTLDSSVPQWNLPPFLHRRAEEQLPGASPLVDSLPNVVAELSEGQGDILTADERTRLPFAVHQTNRINHAEALWDPILQAQVLRILGVDIPIGEPPTIPPFWG